ncbi:MAG: DUF1287 domain-containing protein [Cyclobacteriaceae bacterium]
MVTIRYRSMRDFIIVLCLLPSLGLSQNVESNFYSQLADSAETLSLDRVIYNPAYFLINYPNGDIPEDKGVCTDVVIRAYRKLGIDLQQAMHEDMKNNFDLYPGIWGLSSTDRNIDHRRVPNLMKFFERHGESLVMSSNPTDYQPGDIVCWNLGGATTHIGIVTDELSSDQSRYQIIHNIGGGQVIEDMLFDFRIIGHYRYEK